GRVRLPHHRRMFCPNGLLGGWSRGLTKGCRSPRRSAVSV
ncbi:MAG: hypothetical protein AVDCRST_MAG03-2459, partial [uncultured Rubrobacteraceae bacterium]